MSALHLDFFPLTDKNYDQFMEVFDKDQAETLYDKATLRNKLEKNFKSTTSDKIQTFIIQNPFDKAYFGFVSYQPIGEKTFIHDMYTFAPGKGNNLFNLIGHAFRKVFKDTQFCLDANAAKLEKFFLSAQEPLKNENFTCRIFVP